MRSYPITALTLVLAIFLFDVAVGQEINLWFLYLAPVCVATARRGLGTGIATVAVCTTLLFVTRMMVGNPFSAEWIFAVNRIGCGLGLALAALLMGLLRAQYFADLEPLASDTAMTHD